MDRGAIAPSVACMFEKNSKTALLDESMVLFKSLCYSAFYGASPVDKMWWSVL